MSAIHQGRVWKYGDNVDTDVIFPGRHTYTARSEEELARHALADLDPRFAGAVQPGDIVVGGKNWGCGSSREQAVTCLLHSGVQVVIALSFGRIFYRNAINRGLWALIAPDLSGISHGDRVAVDLTNGRLTIIETVDGRDCTVDIPFTAPDDKLRSIVEAGGLVPHILSGQ